MSYFPFCSTLTDRYLLPGETYQDLFARVADAYADDQDHAQRVYDYISNLWFMSATPVLSNGGTGRGLPISCYLNSVADSLEGIVGTWNENIWLASRGGGIGTYWGQVRGIGEPVDLNDAKRIEKQWSEAVQSMVDRVKAEGGAQGVTVKAVVAKSDLVAEAVISAAKKHKCDLIVMASHGRKGLKRQRWLGQARLAALC